ncbi:MAG: lectin-like protein [Prochloraceae cyanobacterium]|nr:lectin-like protein [Prochloraceae cyanobacterium]
MLLNKQLYIYRNSIYLLTGVATTWQQAQAEARSLGGNLVTINDKKEQTFLAGLFAGRDLWIGLNDAGVENNFRWVSGENAAYTNWQGGQPNNGGSGEDFTILGSNGSWFDERGSLSYRGIIEIKNPTTPILVIQDLGIIEPFSGSKQVVFTVKLFGNTNRSISVNYSTANGSARAGINYIATNGTLTFRPGEREKQIRVNVRSDANNISGENFFVNLGNPTNAILGDRQAKATIREASDAFTFGNSTYLLTNPANWGQAQVEAQSFGGNLATINTPAEQTFLAGVYAGRDRWIGLSDAGRERDLSQGIDFEWFSGITAYTNWQGGQPNNGGSGEDFAILGSNGSWFDERGSLSYGGIIEIPTPLDVPMPDLTQRQIYTLGNSIYLLTNTALNWGQAQAEAQSVGGNLVTINTPREQTFLAGVYAGRDLWIGLSDAGRENNFQWISRENSTYTNWQGGQPNNGGSGEDFAILGSNGSWFDERGSLSYRGIIEIKNPSKPILTIEDLGIIEPGNGTKEAVFTVRRFGNPNSLVSVNYATANNTAFAGTDYVPTSGRLTFLPGETVKTISVTLRSDPDTVSGERFFVNLSNPSNNAVLGDRQAKATIRESTETGIVTFGNSTYVLTSAVLNWGQAQVEAQSYRGNLVTINTPQEQSFLAQAYGSQNVWIGFSDAGVEGNFEWFNGATAYTNWQGGQPNNGGSGEDFALLASNGNWFDERGSLSYRGIIEIPNVLNLVGGAANDILIGNERNDTINGGLGNDALIGKAGNDRLFGSFGNDNLIGNSGVDIFNGGPGNDTMDGGPGNDTMDGGPGNDTFYLNTGGDRIIEAVNGGVDTIYSPFNYTLIANVENLTLTGSARNGFGNNRNNRLVGNAFNNVLNGGAGNDIINGVGGNDSMSGSVGNDTFYVNTAGDRVFEAIRAGNDRVISTINYALAANVENLTLTGSARNGFGNILNNRIFGNGFNNVLRGGAGNDIINGVGGNDTMSGGIGNDLFYTNSARDIVVEGVNAGIDRVIATVNYTLGANVENLTLSSGALNGTGNNLNNILTGNNRNNRLFGGAGNDLLQGLAGNDLLNGGAGNDAMNGGIGNDTLYVNSFGDRVFEVARGGIDTVVSSINYTLGANLERLTLIGNARNGVGNFLNNILRGNNFNNTLVGRGGNDQLIGGAGSDRLIGGVGRDVLVGGLGADRFVFNSVSERIDVISDFNRFQGDKIQINRSGFGAISTNQFNYNSFNGALLFGGLQIATLQNAPAFNPFVDIVIV